MEQSMKHTISLLVSNKPGVLTRVALVFARRGFNIDSLVVSKAQSPEFSRMNIEATGSERTLNLMLTQLNRLVDVIHAVDHANEDVIQRELALFKVSCEPDKRTEVLQIADTFRGQTVDIGDDTITLQVTVDHGFRADDSYRVGHFFFSPSRHEPLGLMSPCQRCP